MRSIVSASLAPLGKDAQFVDNTKCGFYNANNSCNNPNCNRNHVCLICDATDHCLQNCPSISQFKKK